MSREAEFWLWFLENEDELFHFERDQEGVFDRLGVAMERVHEDLTFEFGPEENGRREFVISAGGLKAAFPAVERLFDTRPESSRFDFIKFRPRRAGGFSMELDGLTIGPEDVFYHFVKDEDPEKIGVLLFLRGYADEHEHEHEHEHERAFGEAGFLFLDVLLGEYAVETYVGLIEFLGHDSRYFDGSHPIEEIGEHFDEWLAQRRGR